MTEKRNARLQELLHGPNILAVPCCHDALSASLIEQAGFEAAFVSGAALTNTSLGISDVGVTSYGEYRNALLNILHATTIPILADVDTGYGGILPILRMVEEYESMGISGIQIEDQIFPKRCAFFGVGVVSAEEMCGRIQAAVRARKDPDFLIIARTDGAKSLGFEEALRRVRLYYEAGADMVFTSMPPTKEAMDQLKELKIPKCVSVVEGTVTETYTQEDFEEMGFSMVKYPQTLIRAIIKTQTEILKILKETGRTGGYRDRLCTQKERAALTRLDHYTEFEAALE